MPTTSKLRSGDDVQNVIDSFILDIFGCIHSEKKSNKKSCNYSEISDGKIIDKARRAANGRKFSALYDDGNITGYAPVTTNLFGSITNTLKGAEKSNVDVGSLLSGVGSILGSNSTSKKKTKTSSSKKKTTKKSSSSDSLTNIIKGLFK